jgi:hypothetical protein
VASGWFNRACAFINPFALLLSNSHTLFDLFYSGALATVLALFKRLRTGATGVARTSLAANAQHIQLPFMYDYQGRAPFDEASGPKAVGEGGR